MEPPVVCAWLFALDGGISALRLAQCSVDDVVAVLGLSTATAEMISFPHGAVKGYWTLIAGDVPQAPNTTFASYMCDSGDAAIFRGPVAVTHTPFGPIIGGGGIPTGILYELPDVPPLPTKDSEHDIAAEYGAVLERFFKQLRIDWRRHANK